MTEPTAVLLMAYGTPAHADDTKPLVVGILDYPPMTIRGADGTWSGICVDAWKHVAADLGLRYTLRDVAAKDLDQGLDAHCPATRTANPSSSAGLRASHRRQS